MPASFAEPDGRHAIALLLRFGPEAGITSQREGVEALGPASPGPARSEPSAQVCPAGPTGLRAYGSSAGMPALIAKAARRIPTGRRLAEPMRYVYLLESINHPNERYIGLTDDLRPRFRAHNAGRSPHTSKFRPWRLVTYIAFSDEQKAIDFERYLKSASGRAFANKRLR
jgi:putative endonuclease